MKSTAISVPIDPRELVPHAGSGYPEVFAKQVCRVRSARSAMPQV